MTDGRRKPGRPRKWSSDAERMRAARAAKRQKQRIEDESRAARADAREEAAPAELAKPAIAEPALGEDGASEPVHTPIAVHARCEATIRKLQAEIRRLEDEYDDSVYDRWILEHQNRMAIERMRDRDPEGLAWLDDQVRRWERQGQGPLEDRRRARRRSA